MCGVYTVLSALLYFQVSKKYVSKEVAKDIHEKAAPFIKWLAEAEEESSESEDDDVQVSECWRRMSRDPF